MAQRLGLDLGTTHTRIWTQEKGVVLRCPTAAAMDSQTNELVATGREARKMLGKTPEGILTYRPVRNGAVTDMGVTARMLESFFRERRLCTLLRRPAVLMAVPCRVTEAEQLVAWNAVISAGARSVAFIPAIFAAAAGTGMRVNSPRGSMILSVGGGLAEAAVISGGCIISAHSSRYAGEWTDMIIEQYLKRRRNLIVGDAAAEMLKIRAGVADPALTRDSVEVCGLRSTNSMPCKLTISSAELYEAIAPALNAVSRVAMLALEGVSPEISADINESGLVLCGGGALLPGMAQAMAQRTGLKVTRVKDPGGCVIRGLGRIIRQPTLWGDEIQERIRSIL